MNALTVLAQATGGEPAGELLAHLQLALVASARIQRRAASDRST